MCHLQGTIYHLRVGGTGVTSEALGAQYQNSPVGSIGDVGVFGFYPNKVITTGEGGMVVSNDTALLECCRILRNQGRSPQRDFIHNALGYNYRLSELQCALGNVQLQQIESFLKLREACVKTYLAQLGSVEELKLPSLYQVQSKISWFAFIVQLSENFTHSDRDNIIITMSQAGIECGVYFPAVHLQAYYQSHFCVGSGLFPATERVAHSAIALPLFAELDEKQIKQVCSTLKKRLKNH